MVHLKIINGDKEYIPVVVGEVKWTTERAGTPGILTFEVVKDGILNFQEGNAVHLYVDQGPIFYGFVFQKKRNKGETISVTAYDQLRYLKNKDSYLFKGKTASQFIFMVAEDFRLKTGQIVDTQYVIEKGVLDNKTLFDMFQELLDITLTNTKKLYVLYDDFGKLTLKNIEDMKLNIVLDNGSAEDFDYTSSIDGETYNQIKIAYDDEKTGIRDIYISKDSGNIEKWGVLQYYEKAKSNVGLQQRVNALLELYNRKTRQLSIKNAIGSPKVRAGCSIGLTLALGDVNVNNFFICEKVTHTFQSDMHVMDLTLRGSDGFV
ncbi:XkdQ/YqbQ family protein [Anaerotignum sp.]|uniref:XkdQ/YqbQ family protein n=1 Tax=Anaerotignum sp. TaxID=2039241 RepID=UPI00289B6411|nr:hydrolase [Anaerotignum sp.]